MAVTKVGGANMIAHAQWPQCPPFPRVAVFYVTPDQYCKENLYFCDFSEGSGPPVRPLGLPMCHDYRTKSANFSILQISCSVYMLVYTRCFDTMGVQ